MEKQIELDLDRTEFDATMAELSSFSELLKVADEFRQQLLGLLDSGSEAFALEHCATSGALVTASLKPTDRLLDLLAAMRAWKLNSFVVK